MLNYSSGDMPFRCSWVDNSGSTQNRTFPSYRKAQSFINRECEFFSDQVRIYKKVNGYWEPVILLQCKLYTRSDIKTIYTHMLL